MCIGSTRMYSYILYIYFLSLNHTVAIYEKGMWVYCKKHTLPNFPYEQKQEGENKM